MLLGWLYGEYYVLTDEFLLALLYIWCKNNPNVPVNVWGFRVMSASLPWVFLLIRLLTGADIFKSLIGVAVGHLYIFLKITLPTTYGRRYLETPEFFKQFCVFVESKISGGGRPNAAPRPGNVNPAPQGGFRAFGGRGQRLG